jgi:hypothetical protein
MVVDDSTSCTDSFLLLGISCIDWLLSLLDGCIEEGAGRRRGLECLSARDGILTGSEDGLFDPGFCWERLCDRADRVGEPDFLSSDRLLDRTSFSSKSMV